MAKVTPLCQRSITTEPKPSTTSTIFCGARIGLQMITMQHAAVGQDATGFWIMIRTIATVNIEIWAHNHRSRFGKAVTPEVTQQIMSKKLAQFPPLRRSLVQEGIEAISQLRPECQDSLELKSYGVISDAFHGLLISSLQGEDQRSPERSRGRSS